MPPHFKVRTTVQNHAKMAAVYADPWLFSLWVKLGLKAIAQFADRTGNSFVVHEAELLSLTQKDRPARALEIIEPLIETVPEADRSPTINTVYGLALAQSGRHEQAVAPLRAALALQPRRAKALFNLGRSLQALERFDEAAEVYNRGLVFRPPENVRFALGFARCKIRLGEIDTVRTHLDDLIAKHPEVGRAWLLMGIVAFEEGRYQESANNARKAFE